MITNQSIILNWGWQSGAYTICKVQFKGEASKISSSSGVDNVEHSHSLATPMNNPGESEVGPSLFYIFITIFHTHTHLFFSSTSLFCKGLQNSSQFSGFLDHHQEMQFEAETQMNFEELLSYDLESLLAS